MPFSVSSRPEPLAAPVGVAVLLRDLIHDRTGSFFEEKRLDILLDKLDPLVRAKGYASFMDYYFLLKYESETSAEWDKVMDALSVQETYFWREMDQLNALVKVLVPKWFASRSDPLRIWSAACATGEEPFTIAMVLHEAGWFDRASIEIVASDASASALSKARRGIYRERSFRTLPQELRAKYFTRVGEGNQINSEIAQRVRFVQANLVAKEQVVSLARTPVVFCRNVFIYFSPDAIKRTVSYFAEGMPFPSHLFVGASESLIKLTTDYDLEEIGGAFVYAKKKGAKP